MVLISNQSRRLQGPDKEYRGDFDAYSRVLKDLAERSERIMAGYLELNLSFNGYVVFDVGDGIFVAHSTNYRKATYIVNDLTLLKNSPTKLAEMRRDRGSGKIIIKIYRDNQRNWIKRLEKNLEDARAINRQLMFGQSRCGSM